MKSPETPVLADLGTELATQEEIGWLACRLLEAKRQAGMFVTNYVDGSMVSDKTLEFRVNDTEVICGIPGLVVRYPQISIETRERFAQTPGGGQVDVRIRDKLKNASRLRNRPAYYCLAGTPEYVRGNRVLRTPRRLYTNPWEVIDASPEAREDDEKKFVAAIGPRSGPNLSKERYAQLHYLVEAILAGTAEPLHKKALE
ncbi:MAG TPA: hypothetical protein VFH39_05225 [Candidatus Saccharimonadales bacterium]|nr:hypothetical protein [Candidatus Saccharimonadales bacterium]